MTNDDEDARVQSGTIAKAEIENLRIKTPADDGASFQIDLLLRLDDQRGAILSLTPDDLRHMLDLADKAALIGRDQPN